MVNKRFKEQNIKIITRINHIFEVGHCHPHVVEKTSQQMALLETNSRFLHDNLVTYAKRITSYMPNGLDKCFFANSGYILIFNSIILSFFTRLHQRMFSPSDRFFEIFYFKLKLTVK